MYNHATNQCVELCGDGKKFYHACDDGNNQDGDGCSRDCKVEKGYTCTGGSSTNKDNCYVYRPNSITITTVGQIRKSSSIVLNVKLNYFPDSLLESKECSNKCNQVLVGKVIQGDIPVSITSEYIPGTSYTFALFLEFGRSYMGSFKLSVSVSNQYLKYFGSIPVNNLEVDIQPSYLLAVADKDEKL